jgi:hypothetical protein
MARQGELEFGFVDAFAVIAYAYQLLAAGDDIDLHDLCTRIETVLDKFLDHGCRALDNLAGGDLINQVVWELLDRHADWPLASIRHFSKSTCKSLAERFIRP